MHSVIKGMGMYLPKNIFSSEEVENMAGYGQHGVRHGLVKMVTGVETRHYVEDNEYSSDLAYKAALNALQNADIEVDEVDTLLFCSVTQDVTEPATANIVASKLGLHNKYIFDVKNGCNAFLTGIDLADSLIKTGKSKTVLVTSGEATSRWVKFNYKNKEELMVGSPVTLSLGDGGGAYVLRGEENTNKGILKTLIKNSPELWEANAMLGGGVRCPQDVDKMYIPGTTKPLLDKHFEIGDVYLKEVLKETGWSKDEVDFFATNQAAKWVTTKACDDNGIPLEKRSSTLTKWGNVAASNIPLVTCEAWANGKIKEGSKVIIMAGAVGFSSCVMSVQF